MQGFHVANPALTMTLDSSRSALFTLLLMVSSSILESQRQSYLRLMMARLNVELRSHESPMDWQWQEGHGPTDTDSPFLKGTADSSQTRGGFAGQKRKFVNS